MRMLVYFSARSNSLKSYYDFQVKGVERRDGLVHIKVNDRPVDEHDSTDPWDDVALDAMWVNGDNLDGDEV